MFDPDRFPLPDLGLHCAGCGYPLAHVSRLICPECGQGFTLDEMVPPGDFPVVIADGKRVKATGDVVKMLREYQIPYVEQTDPVGSVFPPMHGSASIAGEVAVPRERYLEVVDLLRRQQLGEPMPTPPPAAVRTAPWSCPGCGEQNPANFELCWNCETPAEDSTFAA